MSPSFVWPGGTVKASLLEVELAYCLHSSGVSSSSLVYSSQHEQIERLTVCAWLHRRTDHVEIS